MKKLVSMLACVLCVIILTTIGFAADIVTTAVLAPVTAEQPSPDAPDAPDAYAIYKRASKNLDAATSIEMAGAVRTSVELEGVELAVILQQSTVKVLNLPDGNIQMKVRSAVQVEGDDSSQISNADIYYRDGYMYTNVDGETSKSKLDIESVAKQANTLDTNLTREAFQDGAVEAVGDDTLVTFRVVMDELTKDNQNPFNEMLSELGDDESAAIGDIKYAILIGPDHKIKEYDMEFDTDMLVGGVAIKAKNIACYQIVAIDRINKIDFPDGLAAY